MKPEKSIKNQKPKIGLALGSGVARGWAHIGVLRVLKQYGIEPDIVTGTSVGAVVGGLFLAGKIAELEEWALSLKRMKVIQYMDFSMSSGGLISGDKLEKQMHDTLGNVEIQDLQKPFVAIATDLLTGHEIWLRQGYLPKLLRASFSLPGVFPPVLHNNRWLVDGALVNPIPVSVCYALGAQIVIAVNLSADNIGKAKKPGSNIQTAAGFDMINFLEKEKGAPGVGVLTKFTRMLFKRDYDGPSMLGVMVSSLNIIQDRITRARIAGDPPDVQISPRIGHIGILEFDRAEELISLGETAALKALPDIKDALSIYGETINI